VKCCDKQRVIQNDNLIKLWKCPDHGVRVQPLRASRATEALIRTELDIDPIVFKRMYGEPMGSIFCIKFIREKKQLTLADAARLFNQIRYGGMVYGIVSGQQRYLTLRERGLV